MKNFILSICIFSCLSLCAQNTAVDEYDFTLTINKSQARIVTEIVTTLGSQNLVSLGFKRKHLSGLGEKLNGLGAFHFLGYIFSEPSLKKHMGTIKKSNFKWNGFVSGIIPSLKIESQQQAFTQKIQAFAKYLQIPSTELEKKARDHEWDAFIAELVKLCCDTNT